jgi:hypothetical protein
MLSVRIQITVIVKGVYSKMLKKVFTWRLESSVVGSIPI